MKRSTLFLVLFFALSASVFSQTFMFINKPADNPVVNFKYQHPFIKSMYSGSPSYNINIYSVGFNLPISRKINLITDFNFTNFNVEREADLYWSSESYTESALGNIYLGAQIANSRIKENGLDIEFGIFLPTASEKKFSVLQSGIMADHYYIAKYLPNTFSFNLLFSRWADVSENFDWGFEAGPLVAIPTGDNNADTELFLKFGLGARIKSDDLFFTTEFNGLMFVSNDADEFTDRFLNTFGIGAGYKFGKFIPEIFYNLELRDEYRSTISGTLGVKLNLEL